MFDAEFYKSHFDIDWSRTDPVDHFCAVGAGVFVSPSSAFDICKYTSKYPDVYNSGINPLYHYIEHGRFELREKFSSESDFDKKKVFLNLLNEENGLDCIKIKHKRAAIFASYSKDFIINDYVVYYLESLREVVDAIIFVSDNYFPPSQIAKIVHLIDYYKCQNHREYDFGSYKRGLEILEKNNMLDVFDEVVFCNDAVYGPIYPFAELFTKIEGVGSCYDFWGITNATQGDEHIQSYFYVFSKRVLQDDKFQSFLKNVKEEEKQYDVILNYETKLTRLLMNCGYKYNTIIDIKRFQINPAYNFEEHPVTCMKYQSPFLKRKKVYISAQNHEGVLNTLNVLRELNGSLYNVVVNEKLIDLNKIKDCKFSIILPTYNRAAFLPTAIDSVLRQTFQNYELIIIDDCSSDDTDKMILSRYANEISIGKIIYKKNRSNVGASVSRNRGLGLAKNDWICYLDSDNAMKNNFLETFTLSIIKNEDNLVFYSKFTKMPENIDEGVPFDLSFLKKANTIDLGIFVHHKDVIKRCGYFDKKLKRCIDYDFILKIVSIFPPHFLNVSLLYYNNGSHLRISNSHNLKKFATIVQDRYNDKALISVIITAYNHERYIEQALNSALFQSGDFKYEIIVSDDGSKDNTPNIVNVFAKNYPHLVKNLSHTQNMGISSNIKMCLDKAKGKYIFILERDDYWIDPFNIDRQYKMLEGNVDCKMCFSGSYIFNQSTLETRRPKRQESLPNKIHTQSLIAVHNPMITFSSICFHASILKIAPDFLYKPRLSEYSLAFHFAEFGNIAFQPYKSVVYRQHEGSAWTGKPLGKQLEESIQTYKNIVRLDRKKYYPFFSGKISELQERLDAMTEEEKNKTFFNRER